MDDAWARIVTGIPEVQRHHSGRGFKPIPRADFDSNAGHWLERPDGFRLRWLDDQKMADDVMPGDVIFIYDTGDDPAFGYLYPVDAVSADRRRATLGQPLPIRFQSRVEELSPPLPLRPPPWRTERTCKHLASATTTDTTAYLMCPECGRESRDA